MSLPNRKPRSLAFPLLITFTCGLLVSCSPALGEAPAPISPLSHATAPPTTQNPTHTQNTPQSPTTTATPIPSASPRTEPEVRDTPPEGAYLGAGGPIPDGALPVTTVNTRGEEVTVFLSEDGIISCDVTATRAACGVDTYRASAPYGLIDGGDPLPRWVISWEGDRPPILGETRETRARTRSHRGHDLYGPAPQRVLVGHVVSSGSFVCANTEAGMTCWVANSGHGAFMTPEKTIFF